MGEQIGKMPQGDQGPARLPQPMAEMRDAQMPHHIKQTQSPYKSAALQSS